MTNFILAFISLSLVINSFAQQTNETITIGSETRSFIQYLPSNFDPSTESLPVVFILHGLGDNAANMSNIGANQLADVERFIAIYPQGTANALGQNSWQNGTLIEATSDDIGFFNQMIDLMILNHNADPSRIYSSGFSMGSIMSYTLACELNDRIAAIGCMSGTMSTEAISNCVPTYVTPVIHFHGTADQTVPYDSGALPSLSLVPETMEFWRNAHGCDATPDTTQITDSANDGITVDKLSYTNCSPDESVELWRLNNAGHSYMYQPQNDITEMIEIWLFFKKWSHSSPATVSIDETSFTVGNLYPNPTTGSFTLSSSSAQPLTIVNTMGEIVLETGLTSGKNTVQLNDLPTGVYLVRVGKGSIQRLIIQ